MRFGVFGTGMVGRAVGARLVTLDHDVMIGTRDVKRTLAAAEPDRMGNPPFTAWQRQNPDVKLGTFAQAATHGQILVNATNGAASLEALRQAGGDNLKHKILIDISNPLDSSKGMPPTLSICNTDSLGEQIQRAFPQTHVVKTLNTVNAYLMTGPNQLAGAAVTGLLEAVKRGTIAGAPLTQTGKARLRQP